MPSFKRPLTDAFLADSLDANNQAIESVGSIAVGAGTASSSLHISPAGTPTSSALGVKWGSDTTLFRNASSYLEVDSPSGFQTSGLLVAEASLAQASYARTDAATGSNLELVRQVFSGPDDNSNTVEYARITARASDQTEGAVDGKLVFALTDAGTSSDVITLVPDLVTVYTPLDLQDNAIKAVGAPTDATDAANKAYVDSVSSNAANLSSGVVAHERGGLEVDISAYAGVLFVNGGTTSQLKYNLSATSAPTAANDTTQGYVVGSRWVDITNDKEYVCVDNTTAAAVWLDTTQTGGLGGLSNVVEDTTPQLGGNLDVNGHAIVSVSNADIAISPHGTGKVVLDGLRWPAADGSANQILKTDGAGNLSWVTNTAGGIDNLVEDISPQLGGALDVNGYGIVSVSNGNISILPHGTGKVILDGLNWPTADGSANQILKTDGAGNLSFMSLPSAGIANVVEDTTPQLGGNLDVNGYQIVSTSNADIVITPNGTGTIKIGKSLDTNGNAIVTSSNANLTLAPHGTGNIVTQANINLDGNAIISSGSDHIILTPQGTGKIILDGLNWPTSDGTSGQVLRTDGAGNLSFVTITGGGGDVVTDTTPQLGGNLDVNGYGIVSVSNGNIAITPNGTGSVVLDGLNWPQADGSANQYLTTNGSGTLSFATISAAHIGAGTLTHERGGLEADVSAYGGVPLISGGATSQLKYHLSATTAPTVSADTAAGYAVGSRWVDTTNDKEYVCLDASNGAAVWAETTATGTSSDTVLYTAQSPTTSQKDQAKANIGVRYVMGFEVVDPGTSLASETTYQALNIPDKCKILRFRACTFGAGMRSAMIIKPKVNGNNLLSGDGTVTTEETTDVCWASSTSINTASFPNSIIAEESNFVVECVDNGSTGSYTQPMGLQVFITLQPIDA